MYRMPYRWFTEVSGLGLAEEAKRLMQPDTPKREEDMAEALDSWGDTYNILSTYGMKHNLPSVYKIVARRSLTVGRARDHFHQWESFLKILEEEGQFAEMTLQERNS